MNKERRAVVIELGRRAEQIKAEADEHIDTNKYTDPHTDSDNGGW